MTSHRLRGNNRTLALLASLVLGLTFTTIFLIPPFYDWFCRVTGYGGTPAVASAAPEVILDQTVRIRFDASVEAGMPWKFKPVVRSMDIRIGETGLAFYEAHNPTDRPVAGTASFNVFPDTTGGYFTKIACFCFTEQVLQPGETVQMPVSFFVDPAMIDDPDARLVREITLSYTFHETPLPADQAALQEPAAADASAVN
ncbi:cytochrome c oxidase assembly protein [Rhodobacter calidifons]|uniref:Cytochrome c oxidase assembly protein CtaG n=1 Tax=Rhodobacter calidifons TaxID=2715277 RepID=A0ABX0G8D8_9RHOB|nr:cytochrome c oxidase assembly protein [Rhodobacter calidifons]NHB77118.1 cytochrome c oxidase assembly protein [Rhodobacter calidifons]